MSNTLVLNQSYVNIGLTTATYTVPTTGNYNVKFEVTELPPSSLAVLVKKNGSTIFTAPVIGQTQSAMQFKFGFQTTAADVITVVFTGSGNDNLLNSVKSIISIGQGF